MKKPNSQRRIRNLDDLDGIRRLDKSGVYDSIEQLPKQCLHAWEDTRDLVVLPSHRNVNKIVMTGMGGSGLGARVIESVYGEKLEYPLVRVNDYDLPDWVDEKTLVICSSFSGTTEEAVENVRQAQARGAAWMVIASGGTLIALAKKYRAPYYQITPTYNPSKQPRLALGYSIIGQLALAAKAGIINFDKKELLSCVETMEKVIEEAKVTRDTENNQAKKLAAKLWGKEIIFIAARHLSAAAYTIKNQANENAKNFSASFDIPELNHHFTEGLKFPKSNIKDLICLFLLSSLYPKRIQERMEITKEVIADNKISVFSWEARAEDRLSQAFEFIQFGGFVNFYLAMLNGIDPAPVPWVDYFKIRLGQPLGQWKTPKI